MNDGWLPMSANAFPYPMKDVLVAAFEMGNEDRIEVFRCHVAEHGVLIPPTGEMTSIIEDGWVPFALRVDDTPKRDDARFPPVWSDYITMARDDSL
jgi:hypothetical protein